MIITTLPRIDGYEVTEYKGIVTGADTYTVGGIIGEGFARQNTYFNMAMGKAVSQLETAARMKSADAVIGVQISVTSMASVGEIIVTATGTAVALEKSGWDDELPDL